MEETRGRFADPPREYAIYPIVHDLVGVAGLGRRRHKWHRLPGLEEIRECGFGGLVVNAPYAPDYPDNEQDWQAFVAAVEKAEGLGFRLWIYDEKGYPSGTAGGAVLEARPDLEAVGLVAYRYWKTLSGPHPYRSDTPHGKLFKALLTPPSGSAEPVDITDTADERGTLRFEIPEGAYNLCVFVERDLYDGTHAAHSYSEPRRYINLLDARATDEFIRVTHDQYKSRLGEKFGKSIRAFFTDEPSLLSWHTQPVSYPLFPWRSDLPEVFRKRYGYGIELAIVAILIGTGREVVKRRCDFWELVSDELAENFFGKLQDWCRANGVLASGHLLCEESLVPHLLLYGSFYASMKRFDAPGIDQLNSDPAALMSTRSLPIGRLVASVADVFARTEVMTEASDHCQREKGQEISPEWVRASMNWHFALGVNVITAYYRFTQFNADQLRDLNKYVARLGLLLREGRRASRVAVLYPECTLWTTAGPTTGARGEDQPAEARKLAATLCDVSWGLLHRQIDFDYVDEDILNEATLENGALVFGDRRYEAVVLPGARVVRDATAARLSDFMAAGGKVLAAGMLPTVSRDGNDEAVRKPFAARLGLDDGSLIVFETTGPDLPARALAALPRTIRLVSGGIRRRTILDSLAAPGATTGNQAPVEPASDDILAHVRQNDGKLIVFLANMAGSHYSGLLHIVGAGSCEVWNPSDGTIAKCTEARQEEGGLQLEVRLGAYEGVFYVATVA